MTVIRICDRCGREVYNSENMGNVKYKIDFDSNNSIDICYPCYDIIRSKIEKFMQDGRITSRRDTWGRPITKKKVNPDGTTEDMHEPHMMADEAETEYLVPVTQKDYEQIQRWVHRNRNAEKVVSDMIAECKERKVVDGKCMTCQTIIDKNEYKRANKK